MQTNPISFLVLTLIFIGILVWPISHPIENQKHAFVFHDAYLKGQALDVFLVVCSVFILLFFIYGYHQYGKRFFLIILLAPLLQAVGSGGRISLKERGIVKLFGVPTINAPRRNKRIGIFTVDDWHRQNEHEQKLDAQHVKETLLNNGYEIWESEAQSDGEVSKIVEFLNSHYSGPGALRTLFFFGGLRNGCISTVYLYALAHAWFTHGYPLHIVLVEPILHGGKPGDTNYINFVLKSLPVNSIVYVDGAIDFSQQYDSAHGNMFTFSSYSSVSLWEQRYFTDQQVIELNSEADRYRVFSQLTGAIKWPEEQANLLREKMLGIIPASLNSVKYILPLVRLIQIASWNGYIRNMKDAEALLNACQATDYLETYDAGYIRIDHLAKTVVSRPWGSLSHLLRVIQILCDAKCLDNLLLTESIVDFVRDPHIRGLYKNETDFECFVLGLSQIVSGWQSRLCAKGELVEGLRLYLIREGLFAQIEGCDQLLTWLRNTVMKVQDYDERQCFSNEEEISLIQQDQFFRVDLFNATFIYNMLGFFLAILSLIGWLAVRSGRFSFEKNLTPLELSTYINQKALNLPVVKRDVLYR